MESEVRAKGPATQSAEPAELSVMYRDNTFIRAIRTQLA